MTGPYGLLLAFALTSGACQADAGEAGPLDEEFRRVMSVCGTLDGEEFEHCARRAQGTEPPLPDPVVVANRVEAERLRLVEKVQHTCGVIAAGPKRQRCDEAQVAKLEARFRDWVGTELYFANLSAGVAGEAARLSAA